VTACSVDPLLMSAVYVFSLLQVVWSPVFQLTSQVSTAALSKESCLSSVVTSQANVRIQSTFASDRVSVTTVSEPNLLPHPHYQSNCLHPLPSP
jgi:hypothetical protein